MLKRFFDNNSGVIVTVLLVIIAVLIFFSISKEPDSVPAFVKEEIDFVEGDIDIPSEFSSKLSALGVKGIILVLGEEQVQIVGLNGRDVGVCQRSTVDKAASAIKCSRDVSVTYLTMAAAGLDSSSCGKCYVGGKLKSCNVQYPTNKARTCMSHNKPCDQACSQ